MNSERRHELQQNYLADFLGTQLKKVENYTKLIAVVIAVLIFAAVGWGFYRSSVVGARSDATLELLQNASGGDPEALGLVAERYSETTAGKLAKLYQADALLAAGVNALFDDREEAQTQLSEALRQYGEVAQSSQDTVIRSRANLGLARTYESLGQLEDAIAAYNQVVAIGESEAIVEVAQQRIAQLKNPETQEFLVWFEKQDFSPADPSQPPALPSSGSLPDLPNLDLPEVSPPSGSDEPTADPADDDSAPGELNQPQTGTPGTPGTPDAPPAPPSDAAPSNAAEPTPAPAAPASEPAEPTPAPAAPASEPAEPASEPAAPASEPAEPASEPAESEPAASEPADDAANEPAEPASEAVPSE